MNQVWLTLYSAIRDGSFVSIFETKEPSLCFNYQSACNPLAKTGKNDNIDIEKRYYLFCSEKGKGNEEK